MAKLNLLSNLKVKNAACPKDKASTMLHDGGGLSQRDLLIIVNVTVSVNNPSSKTFN